MAASRRALDVHLAEERVTSPQVTGESEGQVLDGLANAGRASAELAPLWYWVVVLVTFSRDCSEEC